jgi:hypothetical protein
MIGKFIGLRVVNVTIDPESRIVKSELVSFIETGSESKEDLVPRVNTKLSNMVFTQCGDAYRKEWNVRYHGRTKPTDTAGTSFPLATFYRGIPQRNVKN